jgi:hypothetical protein
MIPFFRKIRKKMADDNKPLMYMRYAVGEIVLVVIGILIALQINNWHEEWKSKKFEREILFLIDQNLKNDSTSISIEFTKAKQAVELTDRLLSQVSQKKYGDSLNNWMGKIISFERFKSQSSAFEVLKAKGIETISNNDLQLALMSYYDESLFNTYQSLTDVEDSFSTDWIPVIKEDFSEFSWMNFHKPNNSKEFFERPSSVILFKLYRDNRRGSVRQLEKSLNKISEIRTLINQYIND